MNKIKEQTQKIIEISEGNICNRCLGRNFYPQLSGNDNQERGIYVKDVLEIVTTVPDESETCYVCGDIFLNLGDALEKIINTIHDSKVEFKTFLVGCRLPREILEKREKYRKKLETPVTVSRKKLTGSWVKN
jgi:Predicted pseudouridylate synthase